MRDGDTRRQRAGDSSDSAGASGKAITEGKAVTEGKDGLRGHAQRNADGVSPAHATRYGGGGLHEGAARIGSRALPVSRRAFLGAATFAAAGAMLAFAGCSSSGAAASSGSSSSASSGESMRSSSAGQSSGAASAAAGGTAASGSAAATDDAVTPGASTYRGFTVDNVYHSDEGEIHFAIHVPDDYDGTQPYALFVTLPGWQGLYPQGVNNNLETESFGFAAQDYISDLIVVAPQLYDWGTTSARQAIALTEHVMDVYDIDASRVYLEGYSGGGETGSIVMGMRPDLFAAYLHCSSQWDGDVDVLADAAVPVYLVVGESDEYYGAAPSLDAAARIRSAYERRGLSDGRIDQLVTCDVKPASYYAAGGQSNQHGGGEVLFSNDPQLMGWLFDHTR